MQAMMVGEPAVLMGVGCCTRMHKQHTLGRASGGDFQPGKFRNRSEVVAMQLRPGHAVQASATLQGAAVCEWPRVQPEQQQGLLQGALASEDCQMELSSAAAASEAALCSAAAEREDMQHAVQMLNKLLDGWTPRLVAEKESTRSLPLASSHSPRLVSVPVVPLWEQALDTDKSTLEAQPDTFKQIQQTYLVQSIDQQSPTRPPQRDPNGRSDDFYTNVGDAIRTLRRELPTVFYQDLSYDIYREDIVFRDPRNVFIGIDRYKTIFKTLRFFGRVFFRPKSLTLQISRIWQPNESKIVVKWSVKGVAWMPFIGGSKDNQFDAISEFKLDRRGKIYEHKVSNTDLTPDNYLNVLQNMLQLNMARAQTPTPSYFLPYLAKQLASMGIKAPTSAGQQ